MRNCLILVGAIVHCCQSYQEPVYVDRDSVLNNPKTRIEIEELGRFDEVFSDHVVEHPESQTRAHVSSSTEDIIDIFNKEQLIIKDLLRFLESLETELKNDKSSHNLNKLKKAISSLKVYLVDDHSCSSSVVCNPAAAFNLVWRTTKLWPQKIKTLTAHLKMMKTSLKRQKKTLATFPEKQLTTFPVTETPEMAAAARGLLIIQQHSNISCEQLASGFGHQRQRLSVEQMMEVGHTARLNSYLNFAVDWYQIALDHSDVKEDKKLRSKLRSLVAEAKEIHDRHLVHDGFFQIDHNHKRMIVTNERLYDTELEDSVTFQKHK